MISNQISFGANPTNIFKGKTLKAVKKEITQIAGEVADELDITHKPNIIFSRIPDSRRGGGYTFTHNGIKLNLTLLTNPNLYKCYIVKKDKKTLLIMSKKTQTPRIGTLEEIKGAKKSIKDSITIDDLIAKPFTLEERKKYLLQTLAHELKHTEQFDLIRRLYGFKKITKEAVQDLKAVPKLRHNLSSRRCWKQFSKEEFGIYPFHPEGFRGQKLFEAYKSSPSPGTPEYYANKLEKEAFSFAADFIKKRYGGWA